MHELLCLLNQTVGAQHYGSFTEWARPFHRQDAEEAIAIMGSLQEVDAYAWGGSIRLRWYMDYPQSRVMPLPLPRALTMVQGFKWPVFGLQQHVKSWASVRRSLTRSHRLYPGPLRTYLVTELIPAWFGLNPRRSRTDLDSYEKASVLSHMVEDGNEERLATVVQEMVWLGYPEHHAHLVLTTWGGCRDITTCGKNQPWCERCGSLLKEMGQGFNVAVVSDLLCNWLTCWHNEDALASEGHTGPIHRCGAACPYRRVLSDYKVDTWAGLL